MGKLRAGLFINGIFGLFLGVMGIITLIANWSRVMETAGAFHALGYGAALGCTISYCLIRILDILKAFED